MQPRTRMGLLTAVLLLASSGALAQAESPAGEEPAQNGNGEETGGVTKELKDLGREIQRAMRDHGEYAGDKLGDLSEEGRSWMGDRALQARVKTTLMGVLGMASVGRVNVDVDQGVVTLKGELDSWERVARAVQATNQVEGVRRVVSQLNVPDSV